jgi:hypothetical protein
MTRIFPFLTGTRNDVVRRLEDDQKRKPEVSHVIVLETAHVIGHVTVAKINQSLRARKRRMRRKMKPRYLRRKRARKEVTRKWRELKKKVRKKMKMKL